MNSNKIVNSETDLSSTLRRVLRQFFFRINNTVLKLFLFRIISARDKVNRFQRSIPYILT